MTKLGIEEGTAPSKVFLNQIQKATQKTTSIIRLLGLDRDTLVEQIPYFKDQLNYEEFEQILIIAGFSKYEVPEILAILNNA